ncbi:MAG: RsmE family RNA methyltransferase [Actinomycetota bacterium]
MTVAKLYVSPERLKKGSLALEGDAHHHLSRVLRIKHGEEIGILDGAGRIGRASVLDVSRNSTLVDVRDIMEIAEQKPRIHLYQALPRGKKMDRVVQSAVELGVFSIKPFACRRSIPLEGGGRKKVERWRRIALESSRVAGRAYLPEMKMTVGWDGLMESLKGLETILTADEEGGCRPSEALGRASPEDIGILIGPEGGFAEDEREYLKEAGAESVTLGGLILRTETAGLVLVAAVKLHFGLL